MGWAKYYEDNVSIMTDRFRMSDEPVMIMHSYLKNEKDIVRMQQNAPDKVVFHSSNVTMSTDRNERRGLELSFMESIDTKAVRKLRLNGWWWSNLCSAWCNTDTMANRRFAQTFIAQANDYHISA